ncbi:MAG: Rpn family recombination-promoting nuclease/putative transposase [Peptococcaceae bacterium]|nr:Rpn family recombination-promoting nuclease/putative transposase [Peptococcaceae bacterium]
MGTNRKYKDSLFSLLFNNPDRMLEIYNALTGSKLPPDTPVEPATLEDVLFMSLINDVAFVIDGKLVVLIEHQSTINQNMPLRLLLYLGRVYEKLLDNKADMLKTGSVDDSFSRIQYDLPEGIGNYTIEADFRFGAGTNTSRWAAIMFRIQSDANNSYYQMAVRKASAASNGVEFAEMLPSGSWASPQPASAPFTPSFGEGITHRLRVEVSGNNIKEYIDGQLIISSGLATRYQNGSIGFQSANMELYIDNIRVSAGKPNPEPAGAKILNGNIVGCPTVITRINDINTLDNVINDDVTTSVMVDYTSADNAVALLDAGAGKVLPLFVVNTMADAVELANLVAAGYTDTHMASPNPEIVKAYRDIVKNSRASLIIDQEIRQADVRDIVSTAHACWALNVIVTTGRADKETIEAIQKRLISVWMVSDDTTVGNHEAITSGVTGIVTADPTKLKADASIYTTRTLTRRPFIIAHRGLSGTAPENTLIAYRKAYEAGADMFETDIYLSKDGEVFLLHDSTFARTTDITNPSCRLTDSEVAATGKTRQTVGYADLTMEQIRKLDAGSWKGVAFAGEPIPTLRELLEYMQGKDVVLFCELKDPNMALIEKTMAVIHSMGMENQVIFINNNNLQTNNMVANYPDMPCGTLNNVSVDLSNPLRSVSNILNTILPMNVTYNPYYSYLNKEIIAECMARGLPLWPWTLDDATLVKNFIDYGTAGITTNYTDRTANAVMGIFPERRSYTSNGAVTVNYTALTNAGIETNLPAEFLVLDGAENIVEMDSATITVVPGTSVIVLLKVQSPAATNCASYTLYSQPITINGV